MKRYFAHYIYIHPDWYLKYCVVEMNDDHTIKVIYPYKQEMEKTSYFQGLLSFYPETIDSPSDSAYDYTIFNKIEKPIFFNSTKSYQVLYKGRRLN